MYMSELGINTALSAKWMKMAMNRSNTKSKDKCTWPSCGQERKGQGQDLRTSQNIFSTEIERQYPAVVPSNLDKLWVPYHCYFVPWQCFPVQISVIRHLEEHIEGVERLLGFCPQRRCDLQSAPSPAIQCRYGFCYQDDVNLHPLLVFSYCLL